MYTEATFIHPSFLKKRKSQQEIEMEIENIHEVDNQRRATSNNQDQNITDNDDGDQYLNIALEL